jgi:uncharacterized protein (DUF1501 family)
MGFTRRKFIKGACCAAVAAMGGARIGNLAFAQNPGESSDVIISIFLRGGMDSLSFMVPYNDVDYHTARSVLAMDSTQVLDVNGQFGLHPSAAPLLELIQQNHLAVVTACGSPDPSRSHFEAQDYMELGTPGYQSFSSGGWLARHLSFYPNDSIFRAVTHGSTLDVSLEGLQGALAMNGAEGFSVRGNSNHRDDMRRALREMYTGDNGFGGVALATLDAVDIVDKSNPDDYVPPNGTEYPNSSLSNSLASIAQMIRLDLGLQVATINYGGWDTHDDQASSSNPTTGEFADNVRDLSEAIHAFWNDMSDQHGKITLVVMSEFGRRLKENNNRGTDHGHAGIMMVLSSDLLSGGVHGTWPGLSSEALFEGVDLEVTTDFRSVLSEILVARAGNPNIGEVFPGYNYGGTSMGLFDVQSGVGRGAANGFMNKYS